MRLPVRAPTVPRQPIFRRRVFPWRSRGFITYGVAAIIPPEPTPSSETGPPPEGCVVQFTDTFDRANVTTIDTLEGWRVSGNPIGITLTNAANAEPSGTQVSIAHQEDQVPLTKDQYVRAWVSVLEESGSGVTSYVAVGMMGRRELCDYGFGVQLLFGASGVRTLNIIRATGVGTGMFEVVASGTVELIEVAGTDLGVPQEIAIASLVVPGGLLLKAYLNEEDVWAPTLEFFNPFDRPFNYPNPSADYGDWWFAIGDQSGPDMVRVQEFNATDQFDELVGIDAVQIKDQLTLEEIRNRVKRRYSRSSNTNLVDTVLNEYVNDAVMEVWHEMTDIATWQEPNIELVVCQDSNSIATMPRYMESVLSMWRTDIKSSVPYYEWGRTSDDRVMLRMNRGREPASFTAKVTYRLRQERMDDDTDRCAIPREYADVIDYNVLMRIAEADGVQNRVAIYDRRYNMALLRVKQKENQKRMQKKLRVGVVKMSHRVPGQLTPYGTTGP